MKEPIRKISIYSNLLEEQVGGQLTEKTKSYLDKIVHAAERLTNMVEGVLNYSTASYYEGAFEPIDLNALLADIQNDLELLIAEKRAIIRVENLPAIEGMPFLVYQLFYNLLNNSLKFTRENAQPVITLSTETVHQEQVPGAAPGEASMFIKIAVSDNGIGFNQQESNRIFDTFARLHSQTTYEGTGLGLALCKNIMKRHNGYITAEGHPGKGAAFNLFFPVGSSDVH